MESINPIKLGYTTWNPGSSVSTPPSLFANVATPTVVPTVAAPVAQPRTITAENIFGFIDRGLNVFNQVNTTLNQNRPQTQPAPQQPQPMPQQYFQNNTGTQVASLLTPTNLGIAAAGIILVLVASSKSKKA